MKKSKPPEIKKHHHKPSREDRLFELLKELIELLGDQIMGMPELLAAIAANKDQTASVTTTDAAAVTALGAGGSGLDAATAQIVQNTADLKTANDALAAALPPVVNP